MLQGPSFIPQTTKNALILFHGYGADGSDLFSLSYELREHFKEMAFFTPNAPSITYGGGYEWFSLDDYFEKQSLGTEYLNELKKRAEPLINITEEYIQQIEKTLNLKRENIFVGGFSQGGLIASLTALSSKSAFNGLVLMSPVPITQVRKDAPKFPILLTRGLEDSVIPPQAQELTKPVFQNAGYEITEDIDALMGHGISEQNLNSIINFIAKNIKN